MMNPADTPLALFATCPQSRDLSQDAYLRQVIDVSQWSEQFGYQGILVYSDNGIVDPWFVSQIVLQHTRRIEPLIAIQPVYMHPYVAAKKVSTLGFLHNRRVALNMLAGGFKNDLAALDDRTPHDDRYRRMVEYALIVRQLLQGPDPVTFGGTYYTVKNLRLTPPLAPELFPTMVASGSSEAGIRAAREIGAVAVRYPGPPGEDEGGQDVLPGRSGVRVGIIARKTANEAWAVACARFPEDRKGRLMHEMAMKVSDSEWHKQLSWRDGDGEAERSPYWLGPFQNYRTFCPYLVGAYQDVADLIAEYIRTGSTMFILDIPPNRDELEHTAIVFSQAALAARLTRV
jgi:alkanesulfonate monooxygenase